MKRAAALALLLVTAACAQEADVILRAMKDEADRSRTLAIASLDNPYYIEYALDDVHSFTASASLGALVSQNETRFRIPRVRVRVGSYEFDNTNYVFSDFSSAPRYDPDPFPIDNDYSVIRRAFWLATDRAYKGAVEAIARKRAALKNVTQTDKLPDFWKAAPSQSIESVPGLPMQPQKWPERVKQLSAVFGQFPDVVSSNVNFNASRSTYYLHTSEGTSIRRAEPLVNLQVQAMGYASDGSTVRDGITLPRLNEREIPNDNELKAAITGLATNIRELAKAPAGDSYAGPVLFEGIAGAQIIAELLAPNLALSRMPVAEPSRPVPVRGSELEGRIGSRILPEFLDVIDDPAQSLYNGIPLIGGYKVDEEGVPAKPVTMVDKGKLAAFALTRQPVKGFDGSNGRARVPGSFGARAASVSNLLVRSTESAKPEDLRKKLMELVQARGKPYGVVVRKMDFPSSASTDEVRRIMMAGGQGGASRPVSSPLLVYRVYPDGKEELIRGVRFRGLSVRSLRDIIGVSDTVAVLHYLNNLAPMAMVGAGSYAAPVSVVAPSLLFDELELERPQFDNPKLPAVPAPPLTAASR
jgi:predicted Zn-dependent protease